VGMVRVLGVYCLPADAKFSATLVALGELLVHLGFQVYYKKRDINGDARQMSFIDHDLCWVARVMMKDVNPPNFKQVGRQFVHSNLDGDRGGTTT
jgi:hypothetical protein